MQEHQQVKQSNDSKSSFQRRTTPANQTYVSNPAAIIQRARINPKSLSHADVMQLQRTMGNRAVGMLLSGIGGGPSTAQQTTVQRQQMPEGAGNIQCSFESMPEQATCPSCSTVPIQREEGNRTGMPDNLKSGVEQLSGMDLSDVRVHYDSDKPMTAGALAYAQGNDIYLGPGQDMHLPHEAWHVVQQAQGRVRPTLQLKNLKVNDDIGLETEADIMGEKASHTQGNMDVTQLFLNNRKVEGEKSEVIQCWPDWLTPSKETKRMLIKTGLTSIPYLAGAGLGYLIQNTNAVLGLHNSDSDDFQLPKTSTDLTGMVAGGFLVGHWGKAIIEHLLKRHWDREDARERADREHLAQGNVIPPEQEAQDVVVNIAPPVPGPDQQAIPPALPNFAAVPQDTDNEELMKAMHM